MKFEISKNLFRQVNGPDGLNGERVAGCFGDYGTYGRYGPQNPPRVVRFRRGFSWLPTSYVFELETRHGRVAQKEKFPE